MKQKYDRNLIVIGAGSAGLVTSYIAAAIKAKVTLIEKDKMGGDCLNTGCVPSKTLIRSARLANQLGNADTYGIESVIPKVDFKKVMNRVKQTIQRIEPHDSIERYTSLGVECIKGEAKLISANAISVNHRQISTRNIVIATGASPFIPAIKGLDKIASLNSDTLWDLTELPEKLVVLGGGPIGCELAQAFARLGSQVTLVEMAPSIMLKDDADAAMLITQALTKEGVNILTRHQASEVVTQNKQSTLVCQHQGQQIRIQFDQILVAVGRKANTENLGLQSLGIQLNTNGTIKTDARLNTNIPSIFACGDVAGPYQFTHTASHQAWYASINSLFSGFKQFNVDYSVIPWVTYTSPEVAQVGITQQQAIEQGINYDSTVYPLSKLDRAITEGETSGFVKVITVKGKDNILGASIVGSHAGEMIVEFVLAMKYNLGLNKILATIHPYPTWMEANKHVAGQWKGKNAPEWTLNFLQKFHQWRR